MRIRPWVATASVTVVAVAALWTVVAANDPATASAAVKFLFWATVALSMWGISATVLLVLGSQLPQAAWSGLILSAGLTAALATWQNGWQGDRLLGGVVFATLSLAFTAWYRLRDGRT